MGGVLFRLGVVAGVLLGCAAGACAGADASADGPDCEDADAIIQSDGQTASGLAACAGGGIVLEDAAACAEPAPPGRACDPDAEELGPSSCETDADCTGRPQARCIGLIDEGGEFCGCRYGCASTADCDAGDVCQCASDHEALPDGSQCVAAGCGSGDECEGGQECMLAAVHGCPGHTEFVCTTRDDECITDSDCSLGRCYLDGETRRCQDINC